MSASAQPTSPTKITRPRIAPAIRKTVQDFTGKPLIEMLSELKKSHKNSANYTDTELLRKLRNEISSAEKLVSLNSCQSAISSTEAIIFNENDDIQEDKEEVNLLDFTIVSFSTGPVVIGDQEPDHVAQLEESREHSSLHLNNETEEVVLEATSEESDVRDERETTVIPIPLYPCVLTANIEPESMSLAALPSPSALPSPAALRIEELEQENATLQESLTTALANLEESSQAIVKMSNKFQRKIAKKLDAKLAEINDASLRIEIVYPASGNNLEIAKIIAFGFIFIFIYYLSLCL
jgi:flagellar motility protein MotE (MotC chaperone)